MAASQPLSRRIVQGWFSSRSGVRRSFSASPVAAALLVAPHLSWNSCSCASKGSPLVCSIVVIHQEKWVHRQTRRRAASEYASASVLSFLDSHRASAGASSATSATARFEPLGAGGRHDVGGVPRPGT